MTMIIIIMRKQKGNSLQTVQQTLLYILYRWYLNRLSVSLCTDDKYEPNFMKIFSLCLKKHSIITINSIQLWYIRLPSTNNGFDKKNIQFRETCKSFIWVDDFEYMFNVTVPQLFLTDANVNIVTFLPSSSLKKYVPIIPPVHKYTFSFTYPANRYSNAFLKLSINLCGGSRWTYHTNAKFTQR